MSCLLLTAAGLALFVVNRPFLGRLEFPGYFIGISVALVYASVGMLILRYRPRLPFGWLFVALAIPAAIGNFSSMYAIFGLLVKPGSNLLGLEFAAWLQNWVQYLIFPSPFAILFVLYPNGKLPSPRWRWLILVSILTSFLQVTGAMTAQGRLITYITVPERTLPIVNPTGILLDPSIRQVIEFTWIISILTIPAGAAAILVRFRAADWVERQQLKWLVYFLVLLIILIFFSFFGNELVNAISLILLILLLPIGTALAILRYNLYGIDVIIRRTVQYTLLTGILAAVYFGLVLVLQTLFSGLSEEQSPIVLVISTLAIAALFNPFRLRILAFIDRRFFRSRYDAEQILLNFSDRVRSEVDLQNLSNHLVDIVHSTIQPEQINLWIRTDTKSRKPSPLSGNRTDA